MKKLLFLLLLIPSLGWGELSKVYPTSAIAVVRLSAYIDGISTVYNSTDTVDFSTWTYFGSTKTFISPNIILNGKIQRFELVGSSWTVRESTMSWTLKNYNAMLLEEAKQRWIMEVADKDLEIYMVYPSSTCPPGWRGWGSQIINGNVVAVPCP